MCKLKLPTMTRNLNSAAPTTPTPRAAENSWLLHAMACQVQCRSSQPCQYSKLVAYCHVKSLLWLLRAR